MTDEKIARLGEMINAAKYVVFFGGAGVSTESGIPDFRSVDGLYSQKFGGLQPEYILSHDCLASNPALFYKFYKEKLIIGGAKPNAAHIRLADMEKSGKLRAVITQNIDGLHQAAGSQTVCELHGSLHRNYCGRCGKRHTLTETLADAGRDGWIPHCGCGGIIRPEVTLYGEQLDSRTWFEAQRHIGAADLLIVGGTSLTVYPAAGFIHYRGAKSRLVIINKGGTAADGEADLVICEKIGKVFRQI